MSQALARALALFDDCVALSPAERAALLADLAMRDPDAHGALLRLLASDGALQEAGDHDLLPSPSFDALGAHAVAPVSSPSADARVGGRLGPWRIERALASGGMGTVYEAWRDDGQYQQRVALKCIRSEVSSPRLIEALRREREALAALDHPGIAALIDGGVDDDGQPWFAMRYVQGMQIDAWCEQHKAGLRQRVDLLLQVCDALAYAHQHMRLHQDIKPSNLLVTATGQVQVLDFGLTASLAGASHLPRLAASDGYTAPEALNGAMPSVAMEVWSLGMLVYRLLCGQLPRTPSHLLTTALKRGAPEAPPLPMSTLAAQGADAFAQACGASSAVALSRQLRGDLDAIAARCVAHLPDDRYPSVAALRADLLAWQRMRPVQARGGGTLYRGRRFLRRHRLAAALSGAFLVLLVSAGGLVVWQERQAAREVASNLALSQVFERTLGTATLSGLGDTPMSSRRLLEDTERQVRTLPLQEHPVVLARGLSMLARNYSVVGDFSRATALAQEAAALQGDDPAARAAVQATLASLLNLQGRPADAGKTATDALAVPAVRDHGEVRLQLMTELARSQWDLAEQDAARRTLDQALAIAGRGGSSSVRAELLTLRGAWKSRLFFFAEAEADLERAIALAGTDAPLVANQARQMAIDNLLQQERNDEGLARAERLLDDYRRRLGDTHPLTAKTWIQLANLQCARAQFDACASALQNGEPVILERYTDDHPEYANILRIRALLAPQHGGTREDALAYLRRADDIFSARYPASHPSVQRIRAQHGRRTLLALDTSPDERKRHLDEVIAIYESILAQNAGVPLIPLSAITLANALSHRDGPGDAARAHRLLADNRRVLSRFPANYNARFYNEYMQAQLHLREGDLAKADAILAGLIAPLRQHQTSTNNKFTLGLVHTLRAAVAQEGNDAALAGRHLVKARDHFLAAFGPAHMAVQVTERRIVDVARSGRFEPAVE